MGGAGISSPGSNLAGRVGWLAPGSFVLPNLYNVDLRLGKQFAIAERFHGSVRGAAFNLFNATLIQEVGGTNHTAYDYATPGQPGCPASHLNTCMVPISTFQVPSITSGNLLGARQLQAGVRFEF